MFSCFFFKLGIIFLIINGCLSNCSVAIVTVACILLTRNGKRAYTSQQKGLPMGLDKLNNIVRQQLMILPMMTKYLTTTTTCVGYGIFSDLPFKIRENNNR